MMRRLMLLTKFSGQLAREGLSSKISKTIKFFIKAGI